MLGRVGFAALALVGFVYLAGHRLPSAPGLWGAFLVMERPWQIDPGALTWAALLGLALLSTALAYVIYFRILASAGATNLLLVTFLIPVSALILGVVVLGERPAPSALAGLALIFAGLAAVGERPVRLRRAGASGASNRGPGP